MLTLFQPKHSVSNPTEPIEIDTKLLQPESAANLLATPRRQRLIEHIWQRTSLSRKQFTLLYLLPLERYAELTQQFPASESHHHAYPGGMLDHGLEVVAYALKLRQSYLLPNGSTSEDQAVQTEAWSAATAYGALLHDIGKIAVDLHVEMENGQTWHPWHGMLLQPYRFRYRKDREYRLHNAAAGLLYNKILSRDILDWLIGFPEAWSALLYVLAGQYEHAGVLGELVRQADQASVAQELGGDPVKAIAAPKHALQRKLLKGLRYLLKEELKLNQPEASDGWLTSDALWLVSKTVSDKLRAHLLSQGIDGIPANNTAVFNVLQEHSLLQPTPDDKAIWRATITSDTGWSHSFTLLRLAPALIWEGNNRPAPFMGTVTIDDESNPTDTSPIDSAPAPASSISPITTAPNDGVDDLLTLLDPSGIAPSISEVMTELPITITTNTPLPTPLEGVSPPPPTLQHPDTEDNNKPAMTPPSGEHFIAWLKQSILNHKIIINDAKALIHTLDNTAYLVSPGVFQRYAQEHPQTAKLAKQDNLSDWQWIQKRFEKLQLHRKQNNGLNIWTCEVTGPRKSRRLHGYFLESPSCLFDETPPNNPYLSILE